MKIDLNSELKVLIKPILFLLVLIVLSLVVVKVGFGRISTLRSELETEKKNEAVLSQKESYLREVQAVVSANTEVSLAAIPAKNPALIVLNQLRSTSLINNVLVSNIKIGTEIKESDMSSIQISFDVDGEINSVIGFIKNISNLLPICLVNKVKVAAGGEDSRANVSMKVYFSPYPTKLTPLNQPIEDLSAGDKEVLSKLGQRIMPSFVEIQPVMGGGRVNPFE